MSTTIQIQYAKKVEVLVKHFPATKERHSDFLVYYFTVTDDTGNKQVLELFADFPLPLQGMLLSDSSMDEIAKFKGVSS